MGFEVAVQAAVYSNLGGYAPLLAVVSGVFDDVDEFVEFPYVTIGESTHDENDTVAVLGDAVTISIHVWSRKRGKKETKTIQGLIYDALHRSSLIASGYDIISCDWESSQSFIDQDGLTRHGVQSFKILIDKI